MGWRRELLARLGAGAASGAAALALVACAAPHDHEVGARDAESQETTPDETTPDETTPDETTADETMREGGAAIVGGRPEPGRTAVVALVRLDDRFENHQLVCSGVLITPTIVVTAAHCIHPHMTGFSPEELTVVFGPDITSGERMNVLVGAYNSAWRMDDAEAAADIGALRLAGVAPVDPIPLGPSPTPGSSVLLVGYGSAALDAQLPEDAAGVKRSGAALVGEVSDASFQVMRAPSTTCSGDSGGATLANLDGAEVLLGIHSRGDCTRELWNERVDAHTNGFLKGFLGEYGGCGVDSACSIGCPNADPDCPCQADGLCDAACAPGEDADCEEDACEDRASDGRCCDDGACAAPSPGTYGGGWGSAGCAVATTGAPLGPPTWLALLGVSLAFLRRSTRGGSSRSGSSRPL